jgi:hypothetical protein
MSWALCQRLRGLLARVLVRSSITLRVTRTRPTAYIRLLRFDLAFTDPAINATGLVPEIGQYYER